MGALYDNRARSAAIARRNINGRQRSTSGARWLRGAAGGAAMIALCVGQPMAVVLVMVAAAAFAVAAAAFAISIRILIDRGVDNA